MKPCDSLVRRNRIVTRIVGASAILLLALLPVFAGCHHDDRHGYNDGDRRDRHHVRHDDRRDDRRDGYRRDDDRH